MEVGDLRVQRDFVDWRDGIEALRLACETGRPGEVYNVASGVPRQLQALLDWYCRAAGVQPEVVSPAHLARPGQSLVRYGNASRLRKDTGWEPRHPIEETLAAILEWWTREMG
jgi:GDP-4-dehydro-6-deoxy-D-mannose reductase